MPPGNTKPDGGQPNLAGRDGFAQSKAGPSSREGERDPDSGGGVGTAVARFRKRTIMKGKMKF